MRTEAEEQIREIFKKVNRFIFRKPVSKGVNEILKVLQQDNTLTSLYLRHDKIGDIGAEVLGKVLEQNSTLASLNLGSNNIGAAGAASLSEALKQNTTLTSLNIGYGISNIIKREVEKLLERNRKKAASLIEEEHVQSTYEESPEEIDETETEKDYEEAAARGDPDAQYALGLAYEEGKDGLTKNIAKATTLYIKAANKGIENAKIRLQEIKYLEVEQKRDKIIRATSLDSKNDVLEQPQPHFEEDTKLLLAEIAKLDLSKEQIEAFAAWQKEEGAIISKQDSEKIVQISANLELQVKENTEIISRIDKDLGTDRETQSQRSFIEKNGKLKEYYMTIRLGLNNAFLAAHVIMSGNVQQSRDFLSQKGCDSLGALSKQVVAKTVGAVWREARWMPLIGSIPALIEAMAGFAADAKQQRQMNQLQHIAADSSEAAKIAERVARLLTLAKQREIITPLEEEDVYKSRIMNFIAATIQKVQDFQSGDETTITRLQALADMNKILEYMMAGQVKAEKIDSIVSELVQLVAGANYDAPVLSSGMNRVSYYIAKSNETVITTVNTESALSSGDGQMMKTVMDQMKMMQEKMAKLERENNKLKKKMDELDQDNEVGSSGLAQISKSSTSRQSPGVVKRMEHVEKDIIALKEGIAYIGEVQALMSEQEKYSPRNPKAIIKQKDNERERTQDYEALISAKSSRVSEEFTLM